MGNLRTRIPLLSAKPEFRAPGPEPGETKPNEANWVNTIVFNEIIQKWEKRSQASHPACLQSLTAISGPIFEKLVPINGFLYCRLGGWGPTNQNKPKLAKAFGINGMNEKSAKQTQQDYHAFYQSLAAILAGIFSKFGWMGRGSLSGIEAHGRKLRYTAGIEVHGKGQSRRVRQPGTVATVRHFSSPDSSRQSEQVEEVGILGTPPWNARCGSLLLRRDTILSIRGPQWRLR